MINYIQKGKVSVGGWSKNQNQRRDYNKSVLNLLKDVENLEIKFSAVCLNS